MIAGVVLGLDGAVDPRDRVVEAGSRLALVDREARDGNTTIPAMMIGWRGAEFALAAA